MKRSESIAQLARALSLAQGAMLPAERTGYNPDTQSRYATLADVLNVLRKPFADNGLSFIQTSDDEPGNVLIETLLMHASGEWVSGVTVIPVFDRTAWAIGSAQTYGRRYGLQAITGVAAEADDDARGAIDQKAAFKVKAPEIAARLKEAYDRKDEAAWIEIMEELTQEQVDYLFSQGTRFLTSQMKRYQGEIEFKLNAPKRAAAGIVVPPERDKDIERAQARVPVNDDNLKDLLEKSIEREEAKQQ